MKKIIVLVLLLFFSLPTFSYTAKEEKMGNELLQKMQNSQSIDDYNKVLEYGLKLSEKYNEPINETYLNAINYAVKMNAERFRIVSDKRYMKNVLKYTDIAIEKGSKDTEVVILGIVFAQLNFDTESMIRYYDYLNKINPKVANEIKEDFATQIKNVHKAKAEKKDEIVRFILTGQTSEQYIPRKRQSFSSFNDFEKYAPLPKTMNIDYGFNVMGDYVPKSISY